MSHAGPDTAPAPPGLPALLSHRSAWPSSEGLLLCQEREKKRGPRPGHLLINETQLQLAV